MRQSRGRRTVGAAVFLLALVAAVQARGISRDDNPAAPISDRTGGVITTAPAALELLADGVAHSPTIAALVADLQASDVLVVMEPALDLKHGMSGCTAFVAQTAIRRYLRVRFEPRGTRDDQLEIIGHELWHAREVAHHPEVTSAEAFQTLYATTIPGRPLRGRWDSDGAVNAGRRILRELAAARATHR